MEKLRRLITLVLALCLLTSVMPLNLMADNAVEHALYIYSDAVPTEATEFAKDHFSHFHTETFIGMGFTASEVSNMRLTPGFKAQPFDSNINFADNLYCYPVISNDEIVAVMKVTYYDNKYNYQLEVGDFAESLSELLNAGFSYHTNIVVSQNACYAVADNDVIILQKFVNADEDAILIEDATLRNNHFYICYEQSPIKISRNTVLSCIVKPCSLSKSLESYMIAVPLVDNPSNFCWAACLGSLIDYYNNGSLSYNNSAAVSYRNAIIYEHTSLFPLNNGDHDSEIPYFMNKYTGKQIYKYNRENWSIIASEIYANRPYLTGWVSGQGGAGHMMILCGIQYEGNDLYNQNYYSIALMEPDSQQYVVIPLFGAFVSGYNTYIWSTSYR